MKSPNPVPLSICLGGELHVCLCSLLYGEGRLLCLSSGGMMGCVCVCVCARTCTGVLWPRHWDLAPWGNSCHHEARGSHQPDPEPVPPPQPRSHHFARMAPRTAWFQAPKRQAENLVKGYRSWQEWWSMDPKREIWLFSGFTALMIENTKENSDCEFEEK